MHKRLEHASSKGSNFANIPISRPDAPSQQAVQTKLTIGEPGDKYEQEADRVAAQVVNQINAPVSVQSSQNLQREEISQEEKGLQMKPMLQLRSAKVGMTAAPEVEASIKQARGGGQSLAKSIREPMEQAIGADFSRVKVHTDSRANQLNQSIHAKAFTTGQNVFFRQGEYNPGSRGGQELIAHELTHVVQQNGRAVAQRQKDIIKPDRLYPPNAGLQKNTIDIKNAMGQIQRADIGDTGDTTETVGRIEAVSQQDQYVNNQNALALLENITDDMHDNDKINRLIENISRRAFDYTSAGGLTLFQGRGNCGTLGREFTEIGQAILDNPNSINYRNINQFVLAPGGSIIGDDRTGNTEHGNYWIFQSHAWIEYNGEEIDVLFKGRRGDQVTRGRKDKQNYIFENLTYVRAEQASSRDNEYYLKPVETGESSQSGSKDNTFKGKAKKFGKSVAKTFRNKK
ncbi:eCIS core domain-containing protein [Nostoc sp.]|uniref:eCIS core domain-containing protein n=1 Tax=Nostoc sp. TaxID=1180 RepID=UPI002FF9A71F